MNKWTIWIYELAIFSSDKWRETTTKKRKRKPLSSSCSNLLFLFLLTAKQEFFSSFPQPITHHTINMRIKNINSLKDDIYCECLQKTLRLAANLTMNSGIFLGDLLIYIWINPKNNFNSVWKNFIIKIWKLFLTQMFEAVQMEYYNRGSIFAWDAMI